MVIGMKKIVFSLKGEGSMQNCIYRSALCSTIPHVSLISDSKQLLRFSEEVINVNIITTHSVTQHLIFLSNTAPGIVYFHWSE